MNVVHFLQLITACQEKETIVEIFFPKTVIARYLLIEPITMSQDGDVYNRFCMRFEAIGCVVDMANFSETPIQGTVSFQCTHFLPSIVSETS